MKSNKKEPDKFWFPTLLQTSNNISSNSWFNIIEKCNPNQQKLKMILLIQNILEL
jgi:hypothetical protein